MSRRRVLVGAAIAIVVALVIVLWHGKRSSSSKTSGGAQTSQSSRSAGGIAQNIDKTKRRVAGTVSLDAAPAPGATVRLLAVNGVAALSAQTDASGRFDLGEIVTGRYIVVAEVPRATGASLFVDLRDPASQPPPDQLRLVAHACEGILFGVIRDASGGTIANARISETDRFLAGPGTDSKDDGSYELCVSVGNNVVTVSADGYASNFAPIGIYGRVHRDFELIPEAVVAGRAVRADDNSPVEGARVMLSAERPTPDRLPFAYAISEADGTFRFHGVAPGSYEIRATAPHLAMTEPVQITADINAPVEDVQCSLIAALSIAGKVIDKQKKPVSGAKVLAVGRSRFNMNGYDTTPTQVDGSFFIDSLTPGEYMLRVEDASLPKDAGKVTLDKTNIEGLVLEVDRGGSIAGRVTRAGKPVEGAAVSARLKSPPAKDDNRTFGRGGSETSDADGRFTLSGLGPGTYSLYAESKRVGAFTRGPEVVLGDGETKTGVEVEMELAGSIAGTVVDQANTPVSGVHIRFSLVQGQDFGDATTDDDGKFKATALSGGGEYSYEVTGNSSSNIEFAAADGKPFAPIPVKDGNTQVTDVVIKLRYERLSISGRVVSNAGAPLPDISVSAQQNDDPMRGGWSFGPAATTDTSGAFTIRDLPAGTYALRARSTSASKRIAGVAAGAKGIEIKMPAVGAIEGTLAGFAKPPRVTAFGGDDADMMSTQQRAVVTGNHFTFTNVPIGKYSIRAQSDDGFATTTADVTAGGKATVALENKGLGTVEGRVVDEKQAPVADLRCMGMGSYAFASTDDTGNFKVERVPVGEARISCYGRTGSATGTVTVEANKTAHLDLVTKPRGADARGFSGLELEQKLTDVKVKTVIADSPAERAGIKVGDTIKKVDDRPVAGRWRSDVVIMAIEMRQAGTTVKLTLDRDGKEQTVELKLDPPRATP
jgi:hypothetical protein